MDLLFHWLIPLLIIIAFSKIDKRTILLLSFFAVLPDIDTFFNMHRMIFHNIFVVLIPLFFYFFISRKKTGKKHKIIFILIAYFLLSHIILDLAYPGVALLYPLASEHFYFSIDFMFEDYEIWPVINYGVVYIEPHLAEGEIVSNLAIMVLMLVLLFIAVQSLLKKKKRK